MLVKNHASQSFGSFVKPNQHDLTINGLVTRQIAPMKAKPSPNVLQMHDFGNKATDGIYSKTIPTKQAAQTST